MKKDFTLNIPSACEKSWGEMSKTDNGKFCGHCSTEVVDFRKMSTAELKTYFQSNEKKVCGYIHQAQLNQFNRDLYTIPYWKGFNAKIAIASLMALLTTSKAFSAVGIKENPSSHHLSKSQQFQKGIKNEIGIDSVFIIKGVVKAKDDGLVVPGAIVRVKGLKEAVSTGIGGVFDILVKGEVNKKVILSVSYIGYKTFEFEVVLGKFNDKAIEVILENENLPTGEIVTAGMFVKTDTLRSRLLITGTIITVKASDLAVKKRTSFFRRLMNSVGRLF